AKPGRVNVRSALGAVDLEWFGGRARLIADTGRGRYRSVSVRCAVGLPRPACRDRLLGRCFAVLGHGSPHKGGCSSRRCVLHRGQRSSESGSYFVPRPCVKPNLTRMRPFRQCHILGSPSGPYAPRARSTTFPRIELIGTGPHSRLSALSPRLSPTTNT